MKSIHLVYDMFHGEVHVCACMLCCVTRCSSHRIESYARMGLSSGQTNRAPPPNKRESTGFVNFAVDLQRDYKCRINCVVLKALCVAP